jgi:hypothetical protein
MCITLVSVYWETFSTIKHVLYIDHNIVCGPLTSRKSYIFLFLDLGCTTEITVGISTRHKNFVCLTSCKVEWYCRISLSPHLITDENFLPKCTVFCKVWYFGNNNVISLSVCYYWSNDIWIHRIVRRNEMFKYPVLCRKSAVIYALKICYQTNSFYPWFRMTNGRTFNLS